MSKIGLSLSIDVTKFDKSKFFKGKKGTYAEMKIFVDLDNVDQHGNNGMVVQSWKNAENGETPILGNGKVFWSDMAPQRQPQQQQAPTRQNPMAEPDFDFDDDIPF